MTYSSDFYLLLFSSVSTEFQPDHQPSVHSWSMPRLLLPQTPAPCLEPSCSDPCIFGWLSWSGFESRPSLATACKVNFSNSTPLLYPLTLFGFFPSSNHYLKLSSLFICVNFTEVKFTLKITHILFFIIMK